MVAGGLSEVEAFLPGGLQVLVVGQQSGEVGRLIRIMRTDPAQILSVQVHAELVDHPHGVRSPGLFSRQFQRESQRVSSDDRIGVDFEESPIRREFRIERIQILAALRCRGHPIGKSAGQLQYAVLIQIAAHLPDRQERLFGVRQRTGFECRCVQLRTDLPRRFMLFALSFHVTSIPLFAAICLRRRARSLHGR